MGYSGKTTRLLFAALLVLFIATAGHAQEATAEDPAAQTTSDPRIDTDELSLKLTPLTKAQLLVEAAAWEAILQSKVEDISIAEIAALKADETTDAGAAEKEKQLGLANTYREERTAVVDRMNLVLDELKAKGSEEDILEYKAYITAVSGLNLEVTDSSMFLATLKGWATSKEGGMRWAKNVGIFLVVVLLFWFISIFAGKVVYKVLDAHKNATKLLREFGTRSTKRVVIVIGVIVGLSAMGVETTPLVALIGAAGFIVAFALQDTLGNFASGIMILLYRPFDEGDFVEVAGVSGSVVSLNLVSVTINTPDNKVNIIPNNSVWGSIITNVTGSSERRVDLVFGIGYEDNMHVAQELMEKVLEEHPLVLQHPESVVRVFELADSSVNFVCRPWVKTEDYWTVYWDVTQGVKEAFDAAGITIPFPQQDVHFHGLPGVPEEQSAATTAPHENNPHTAATGEDFPEAPEE